MPAAQFRPSYPQPRIFSPLRRRVCRERKCQETARGSSSKLRMDEIHFAPRCNHGEPLSVTGIIRSQGFLGVQKHSKHVGFPPKLPAELGHVPGGACVETAPQSQRPRCKRHWRMCQPGTWHLEYAGYRAAYRLAWTFGVAHIVGCTQLPPGPNGNLPRSAKSGKPCACGPSLACLRVCAFSAFWFTIRVLVQKAKREHHLFVWGPLRVTRAHTQTLGLSGVRS